MALTSMVRSGYIGTIVMTRPTAIRAIIIVPARITMPIPKGAGG
jgi:hypothetical protein